MYESPLPTIQPARLMRVVIVRMIQDINAIKDIKRSYYHVTAGIGDSVINLSIWVSLTTYNRNPCAHLQDPTEVLK